jgi:hypothetical protein
MWEEILKEEKLIHHLKFIVKKNPHDFSEIAETFKKEIY